MDSPKYVQRVEDRIFDRVFRLFLFWSYSQVRPIHVVRGSGRGVIQSKETGKYELQHPDVRSVSPVGALYLHFFDPACDSGADYDLLKRVSKFRPSDFPEKGVWGLRQGLRLEEDVEKDVWYQMGARLWYRIDDYQTYMMRMHRDLVAEGRLKLRRARSPGGRLSLAPRGTLGG